MPQQFWLKIGEKVFGPHTSDEVRRLAAKGTLQPTHGVSQDKRHWLPAESVKGLKFPAPAEPTVDNPTNQPTDTSPTSPQDAPPVEESPGSADLMPLWPGLLNGMTTAPLLIRGAAIVWMVYGILELLGGGLVMLVAARVIFGSSGLSPDASFAAILVGSGGLVAAGIGVAFLGTGVTTLRRHSGGTLGNGIASIILGLLPMVAMALLLIFARSAAGVDAPGRFLLAAAILLFFPALLMVAGLMAVAGRRQYEAWKEPYWQSLSEEQRLNLTDPNRDQRLKQRESTVRTVSRLLPLDQLPEEKRYPAAVLAMAGLLLLFIVVLWAMINNALFG